MRLFVPFILTCVASATALACVHEEKRPNPILSNENRITAPPPAPPQYLLGDPGAGMVTHIIPLHGGAQGIVVDRRRVIVARGEPRMATDQAPETINGASKLPSRFGGGFLFWTENSIYRSEAFDTALVPVARTPDHIDSISFGPKAIMVRTTNGERYGISVPKGERVPLAPLGLVDVVALDEGRALAFDDRGSVLTSVDHGATWTDATAQVKGKPTRVFIHEEELWLEGENSDAMRLEPDGHLSWFDHVPEDPAQELRPRDPKWRGADFPLRAAIRSGVAIDDSTALVVEAGDVYRIDTHSGDVVSVVSGKLPPDSTCQGMQIPGDVLFACTSRSNNASSFVVSHTLSGDPVIEQTFGQSNMTFYASDDGGLAYAGPCNSAPAAGTSTVATVCLRLPGGTWEERDLSLISTDAGVGPSDIAVARWIPRGDGRVVAIVTDPQPGVYDPGTGTLSPVGDELRGLVGRGSSSYYSGRGGSYRIRYSKHSGGVYSLIDSSWSFGAGNTIRGTAGNGESFEITDDGRVKPSPYGFEALYAFNLGVGRSKDGRLFQTNDHGGTWTEVATPPTGMEPLEMLACSSVGCDFGAFYRLGWQMRPPNVEPKMTPSPPVPSVRRVRGVELSCRPSGPVAQKVLPRTDTSPEDLGLGAVRVPTQSEKNDWLYLRTPSARTIVTPWPGVAESLALGNETDAALRIMLTGFSTSRDDNDNLVVNGPTKNINLLRRGVSYVPPFDPTARIVRAGIQMSEVAAAAKRAGMTTDEIFGSDPTENSSPFVITSADPNAVSDIATYDSQSGLVAVFRGERARLAIRPPNPNGGGAPAPFSAVALPNDETAILEQDTDGAQARVYKIGPGGVVDLFDFPVNTANHLANPDSLSIGPKNELGIIRTPSGGDPPSPFDPAYLVVQGSPLVQLAPWSTMKFADDPACKAEQGGHRTTIQAIGPWIRTTNPDLKVDDAPMIARVRWTATRVCVEGFEVKMPAQTVTVPNPNRGAAASSETIGTWLVGKGSTFARVSIGEGIEWRQPMECTVSSTGP